MRKRRSKTYRRKVGRHDCTIGKFPSGQRAQRFGGRILGVVFDEDLAHTGGLSAAACGPWDLHI